MWSVPLLVPSLLLNSGMIQEAADRGGLSSSFVRHPNCTAKSFSARPQAANAIGFFILGTRVCNVAQWVKPNISAW
jgi:hypothetical protein